MNKTSIIGVDLGGTYIRGARINAETITEIVSVKVSSSGTEEKVLDELYQLIDGLMDESVTAIGIGVPSVVDIEKGIVYDVQNIPSWKKVLLKQYLEARYGITAYVNNDANCFVLGEKYFGKARNYHSFIGLTIGTGLGAGIMINNKLYTGANCGAGEFGMVDYNGYPFEYFTSGQFFLKQYHEEGEYLYDKAMKGDAAAVKCFEAFGTHLGNAIKMILYTYDPALIIIGGSIKKVYPYFQKTMWDCINTFAYQKSLGHLSIEISDLKHCGVLGAGALCYDAGSLVL
ncbi:ROK family protein [Parafilimonas sp.]|uniref:ROK family protein n=1 Tax=Parafilimonas sp. TaxID=1969739 RepID=UPI0039E63939